MVGEFHAMIHRAERNSSLHHIQVAGVLDFWRKCGMPNLKKHVLEVTPVLKFFPKQTKRRKSEMDLSTWKNHLFQDSILSEFIRSIRLHNRSH